MKKNIRKILTVGFVLSASVALFTSAKKGSAVIDPAKAVNELAPVKRMASKPGEGVYYSLFVRAFADSNGDGIGDFNGIIKKLDYLNDGDDSTTTDLGITGIWLLPIFPSQSYHGYDVDDYYDVNPDYGTMADFEKLLAECNKRGISVMIDMTCNHSSSYNKWFIESKKPDSAKRDWYFWTDYDENKFNIKAKIWGHNIFTSPFGDPDHLYAGLFGSNMPDFNLDSPGLREEFKNVMKFWMDKGVSGFRYDAAGHVYDAVKRPVGAAPSTESAVKWWKEIIDYNKSVKPDTYCVGEVWENTATRARYMEGLGSTFHFDMGTNYIVEELRYNDAGKNTFANMMESEYDRYAQFNPDYIDAPFLSNHDQARVASLLARNVPKQKMAAAMYLFCEGVPFMYYGEEIGMMSGAEDPTKRTPFIWNINTKSGTPKDKLQTTFASAADCVYNKKTVSAAEQEKNPDSLLQYYKRLIRVRTAHPALYKGKFKAVDCLTEGISSWQMKSDEETAFVMHNLSTETQNFDLPAGYENLSVVFGTNAECTVADGKVTLPSLCTIVLAGK